MTYSLARTTFAFCGRKAKIPAFFRSSSNIFSTWNIKKQAMIIIARSNYNMFFRSSSNIFSTWNIKQRDWLGPISELLQDLCPLGDFCPACGFVAILTQARHYELFREYSRDLNNWLVRYLFIYVFIGRESKRTYMLSLRSLLF